MLALMLTKGSTAMNIPSKIVDLSTQAVAPLTKAEWRKPELRKLDASEAQITTSGSHDASTVFS